MLLTSWLSSTAKKLRTQRNKRRDRRSVRQRNAVIDVRTVTSKAVEALEDRALLAAHESVLSPALWPLAAVEVGVETAVADSSANDSLLVDAQGRIAVRITATDVRALQPAMEAAGFITTGTAPDLHIIEGRMLPHELADLELLRGDGLLGVIPIIAPDTYSGNFVNEADYVHEADRLREDLASLGVDGSGISIGVLSDSYNALGGEATGIASGDLPNNVTVLQDLTGGGLIDEGRAMLELIHDIAPGAALGFATAFTGQLGFANNIRDLARNAAFQADVIVDDVGYFTAPFFQDGVIAQAVTDVFTTDGVAYFSSAGNASDFAYESDNFNSAADTGGLFSGDQFHDFDASGGSDTRQALPSIANGQRIRFSLQWDDPFFTTSGVDTDLDVHLVLAGTDTIVGSSDNDNIANQTPSEFLVYTNTSGAPQNLELMIEHAGGPAPGRIKYLDVDEIDVLEHDTNSPTVFGHSAASGGMAVAAAPFFNHHSPESFTSVGPTTILFDAAGNPLGLPEIRNTPQITAVDGNETSFFGQSFDPDQDGNSNFHFFGTSAAAPNAAAIAALVLDANPAFTAQQIYDRLSATAADLGTPGFDNLTGAGLINAYRAVFPSVTPAQLSGSGATVTYTDSFENGFLDSAWETNSTGGSWIRVVDNTATQGTFRVSMDASSNGFSPLGLNEATFHVDLAGLTGVQLSFDNREFSDEDNAMPATFTGSTNADGVALSVDGTNWFRLVSLTGGSSTTTYQTQVFDLSAVATANNLTLTADTRIRFQQYDNFGEPTDGIGFDNMVITADSPSSGADTEVALDGSGNLLIQDTNGGDTNDTLTLSVSGTSIRVTDPNQVLAAGTGAVQVNDHTVDVPISGIAGPSEIVVDSLGGDDSLTIDFSGGNFTKAILYQGGTNVSSNPGDQLVLTGGGPFATATLDFDNEHDGSIEIVGNATITYTGLEPIDMTGTSIDDLVLNFTSSTSETIDLTDDSTAGNNISMIDSTAGESLTFATPNSSLTVNTNAAGGAGTDVVNVRGLDSLFTADVAIVAADDDVNFTTNPTAVGAGLLTVDASEILIEQAISTSGPGTITVTADRNILLTSGSSLTTVDGGITLTANAGATGGGLFGGIEADNAVIQTSGTGNISLTGTGGDVDSSFPSAASNYGVYLHSGTSVSSTATGVSAGTITINGTGGDASDHNYGVFLKDSTTDVTSVDGEILIVGQGGGPGESNYGVFLDSIEAISSTGTGTSAATISVNGTGGMGVFASLTDPNHGVYVLGTTTALISIDGDISITGQGGNGAPDGGGDGVVIGNVSSISSTGLGALAGDITIGGTGGGGFSATSGTRILGSTTNVTSVAGNISITGLGGNGISSGGIAGTEIQNDATVQVTSGTLEVIGTATDDDSIGVRLSDSTGGRLISIGSGAITVSATGTGTQPDFVAGADSVVGGSSATGPVTFNADSIIFSGTLNIQSGGDLTIQPRTPGTNINLGSGAADSDLQLNDTELGFLTDGFNSITAGDVAAGTGAVVVSPATFTDPITVVGGSIDVTALNAGTNDVHLTARTGTITDAGGVDVTGSSVTLSGNVTPGQSPGVLTVDGDVVLATSDTLTIEVGGTSPGTANGDHDQVNATGSVTIEANVALSLMAFNGFVASHGDSFTIIDRSGGTGTFTGLSEGAVLPNFLSQAGVNAFITYIGGDGDDVVITTDTVAPSLFISPDDLATTDSPITFTFQFDEAVTGFDAGDVSTTNGSAGTFTAVDGDTYTLEVTPIVDGLVTVSVGVGAAQDVANNDSLAATASVTKVASPLSITLLNSSLSEAAGPNATTARVFRTGSTTAALTVTVTNPDASELYLPATVEIPVGAYFVDFDIETVNDGDIDGDQLGLSIGVSAGADSGSVLIDILDDDIVSSRTLGGHLFEPIATETYTVLYDINVDAGVNLNIAAGSTLKFDSGVALNVDGALTADGDVGSEIRLISSAPSPSAGDWMGIVARISGGTRTILDHVEIAHAVRGVNLPFADDPKMTISNAVIHGNSVEGIRIHAGRRDQVSDDDVIIEDSRVHNNGGAGIIVLAQGGGTSSPPIGASARPTIRHNEIDNNATYGIQVSSSYSAGPTYASSAFASPTVDGNNIHHNVDGIRISAFDVVGSFGSGWATGRYVNNVVANNTGNGIEVFRTGDGILQPDLINNTIVSNGAAGIFHDADSGPITIRNNIVAANARGIEVDATDVPAAETVGYNDVFGNTVADWTNYPAAFGSLTGTNANGTPADAEFNISVDPLFVSSTDFHLTVASQAIGAGTATDAPATDLDGTPRIIPIEIGAYEVATPLLVTTLADEDDGGLGLGTGDSLRELINAGNASPGAAVIQFDPALNGGTIVLNGTQLPELTSETQIVGPGATLMTISGNDASRILSIGSGVTVTLTGLTLANGNSDGPVGTNRDGGAILNAGNLLIEHSTIQDSQASQTGGGIRNTGSLMLTDSVVQRNQTTFNSGGGIRSSGSLTIVRSTIQDNVMPGFLYTGGGVYVTGTTVIESSVISGNTAAGSGGGIGNWGASLTLINSTVSNNTAELRGGGVYLPSTLPSTLLARNSTISGNRSNSGVGGGISTFGTAATLHNTIVAGNFQGLGTTAQDIDGPLNVASSFNLIGDAATAGGLTNDTNGNIVGADPMLGPLQDNGGPTLTHALMSGSPAINSGHNSEALDGVGSVLTTDQRGDGFIRIASATVDIGAFEVAPLQVVDVKVTSIAWAGGFRDLADGETLGSGLGTGYSILTGSVEQTNELPWVNINQLVVTFTEDLNASTIDIDSVTGNVKLHGVNTALHTIDTFTVSGNVLTLNLTGNIGIDRLRLEIQDTVESTAALNLDGDFTNNVSVASGGAAPVGDPANDFNFQFNVLHGDADRSGLVDTGDSSQMFFRFFQMPGNTFYSIFSDVNGSGLIDTGDTSQVFFNFFQMLPTGSPGGFGGGFGFGFSGGSGPGFGSGGGSGSGAPAAAGSGSGNSSSGTSAKSGGSDSADESTSTGMTSIPASNGSDDSGWDDDELGALDDLLLEIIGESV